VRDLRLVIFDCDGVLVDSEVISNEVLARTVLGEGALA
jgi:beta-phosphoglucomutase-like phosphatase (HAD superfamily)